MADHFSALASNTVHYLPLFTCICHFDWNLKNEEGSFSRQGYTIEQLACVMYGFMFVFWWHFLLCYVQFLCLCYVQCSCLWAVHFAACHSLRSSWALRARWARSASPMVYRVIVSLPFDWPEVAHGHKLITWTEGCFPNKL